jgi:hypothetical protein
MQVSYPWREQQSNLIVSIENIYAILTPKGEEQFNFMETLMKSK